MNFWNKLKKPFFVLAPMADVTDVAFRSMLTRYGKPDVIWTEFVSADGLASVEGRKGLKYDLLFNEKERPIVVQLFSSDPIKMREASRYVALLGFDGIDINMGCPDKKVEKQGAGASLMKNMKLAGELIQAVKDGIEDARATLLSRSHDASVEVFSDRKDTSPTIHLKDTKNLVKSDFTRLRKYISVSVKTRIGYNKNQIDEWIPFLLSQNIDALILHARTRKEMSLVPARWEHVKEVVEIRNKMKLKTKIIGNGDVKSIEEGKRLAKETGCDGVMIGRGTFGNPWIFSEKGLSSRNKAERGESLRAKKNTPSAFGIFPLSRRRGIPEKLKVLVEHTKLYEKLLGKVKNFSIMKKHYKAYVNGWDGAKELRTTLMDAKNSKEVEKIVNDFLKMKK